MTRKLAHYISGGVELHVRGAAPERFINLCLAQGIYLWGVRKNGEELFVWVRTADYFRLRPAARKSQTRVRAVRFFGLPFLLRRLKRRKALLAGLAVFLAALYVLTSYIWFVDVTGLKTLPAERILAIAAQNGLRPGVARAAIDRKKIETGILLQAPETAWASVRITGTRAVIEVVEKVIPEPEDKSPADIVAAKDGVVTECIVFDGEAAVKPGDTVKQGDVLIRGVKPEITPADETPAAPPPAASPRPPIRAGGIVKARVWYVAYGEAPLERTEETLTGRRSIGVELRVSDRVFTLKNARPDEFASCKTEILYKKLPQWRNQDFPVEMILHVYHETELARSRVDFAAAQDAARLRALAVLQRSVPEGALVLQREVEALPSDGADLARVKAKLETEEEIGRIRRRE